MPTARALAAPASRAEPRHVTVIKALLYAFAIALYLHPLSSSAGILSAVLLALGGMLLAYAAHRRRFRLLVALVVAPAALVLAGLLGDRLLASDAMAGLLGVRGSVVAADVLTFGLAALCGTFLLRLLAHRARAFSILEVMFVAGSVVAAMAAHRNRMLNRPRFFSDWAWTLGVDPSTVLMGLGAAATLLAVFLFLRDQPLLKLLSTVVLLCLLGVLFYLVGEKRIEPAKSADALGLTGKGKGDGKGGQGGQGGRGGSGSDNPFKDNYEQQGPPQPVAVAILRDDFEPKEPVIYFRQRALSKYNGHHLIAAESADADVITELPGRKERVAAASQTLDHHLKVPTTMYLLVDHPQPPALTHAQKLRLVENPNPRQFVAAYEVESQVLSVPVLRLLGRRSVPERWSAADRAHYTALPDDPRYKTLADIIVRRVDPRFAHDDLAKAYAIKRYLEREGFYTRKVTHAGETDPTADFLFGALRGYCVHFAHAAVYLFRSQGIAARVALGYAVQMGKRGGGSSLLIMGDRAHAWPEIHVEGVGWVTFDVYPERTDLPAPSPVDYDLEKLLGELARNDPTGGLSPEGKPLVIPWGKLGRGAGLGLLALLVLAYGVKGYRRLIPGLASGEAYYRTAYRAVLDQLSDLGAARRPGETRERHAGRLAPLSPALLPLTHAHLGRALGSRQAAAPPEFASLVESVRRELKTHLPTHRRLLALLNPVGWFFTR